MTKNRLSTAWRLAAILLAATILAAACGGADEADAPASTPTLSEQPVTEPAEPAEDAPAPTTDDEDREPPPPAAPVVVEMYAAEFLADYINGVIDSFEAEYPNVDVSLRTFDSYDAVFDSYVLAEEHGQRARHREPVRGAHAAGARHRLLQAAARGSGRPLRNRRRPGEPRGDARRRCQLLSGGRRVLLTAVERLHRTDPSPTWTCWSKRASPRT